MPLSKKDGIYDRTIDPKILIKEEKDHFKELIEFLEIDLDDIYCSNAKTLFENLTEILTIYQTLQKQNELVDKLRKKTLELHGNIIDIFHNNENYHKVEQIIDLLINYFLEERKVIK